MPESIAKIIGGFKDNVVSLFKTNTPKDYGEKTYMGEKRN